MDGAMGTMIQNANLSPEDFGGEEYEGCNEYLSITSPHTIRQIHEQYLEAGADIIETNTFGGARLVLDEYNLSHLAYRINKESAELAKKACLKYTTPEKPRFVGGSMGPTTKTLSLTGGTTFDLLQDSYREQAEGLIDGGVDVLILETCQDMLNVKAAYTGIRKAFDNTGKELPIIISGTIEPMGTTLAGQPIEAFYFSCEHMKPIAVGLNCATGPEFMTDHIRSLSDLADAGISCYPNAGLPDEEGHYHESPESLAKKVRQFAAHRHVDEEYPMVFLVQAENDDTVPIGQSYAMEEALRNAGVHYVMERPAVGGHGFGLGSATPAKDWPERAIMMLGG